MKREKQFRAFEKGGICDLTKRWSSFEALSAVVEQNVQYLSNAVYGLVCLTAWTLRNEALEVPKLGPIDEVADTALFKGSESILLFIRLSYTLFVMHCTDITFLLK